MYLLDVGRKSIKLVGYPEAPLKKLRLIFKLRLGASIGRFVRRSVGHSVTLLVRGKKSESQYLSLCMSDLNQT